MFNTQLTTTRTGDIVDPTTGRRQGRGGNLKGGSRRLNDERGGCVVVAPSSKSGTRDIVYALGKGLEVIEEEKEEEEEEAGAR